MNDACTPETARMLKALKARWTVGEAAKKRSRIGLKAACALAACGVAFAVAAPIDSAYADEGVNGAETPVVTAAVQTFDGKSVSAEDEGDSSANLANASADKDAADVLDDIASKGSADSVDAESGATASGDPSCGDKASDDALSNRDEEQTADSESSDGDDVSDSGSTGEGFDAVDPSNGVANCLPSQGDAAAYSSRDIDGNLAALGGGTLKDLIENAFDGDTITFDDNMTYVLDSAADTITIDKAITLVFNSWQLVVLGDYDLFNITADGILTLIGADVITEGNLVGNLDGTLHIQDGTFLCDGCLVDDANSGSRVGICGGDFTTGSSIFDYVEGTIEVAHANLTCLEDTGAHLGDGAYVTLNGVNMTAMNGSGFSVYSNAVLNFNDVLLETLEGSGIYVFDGALVSIQDGTIISKDDCFVICSGGRLILRGATLDAFDDEDGCIYFPDGYEVGMITIADGYAAETPNWLANMPSRLVVSEGFDWADEPADEDGEYISDFSDLLDWLNWLLAFLEGYLQALYEQFGFLAYADTPVVNEVVQVSETPDTADTAVPITAAATASVLAAALALASRRFAGRNSR